MAFYKTVVVLLSSYYVAAEIKNNAFANKLLSKVRPVGGVVARSFIPLTELPPPRVPILSGRRHLEDDCTKKPHWKEAMDGANVAIFAEYYDDNMAKTVATVIMPEHIDIKHFQVTTPLPYLTVGTIEGLGYHPSTIKSEHPSECEKIYQDHIDEQYSEESRDYSEESLEMARMPLFPDTGPSPSLEDKMDRIYRDIE